MPNDDEEAAKALGELLAAGYKDGLEPEELVALLEAAIDEALEEPEEEAQNG